MFAEMLGIRKQPSAKPVQVVRSVTRPVSDSDNMVDELDVQREVVEAMAMEKAELEDFFHSGWYETLTDIDTDRLIYQCRITAREKEKAAIVAESKRSEAMMRQLQQMQRQMKEQQAYAASQQKPKQPETDDVDLDSLLAELAFLREQLDDKNNT